ncbi:MAG: hypothetical protein A2744_04050 [Candidatus Buchananbacteria bacterium RIFCSPHIGHO2_01_FULL_44_11]|uniref:Uncharacterized protein n=1 Tax=Candidatus Buchananbacteria bacterium RIFCSPHIGHO2_01_FULL_44_11 TaxID=1797535 RepID=A0A1G1Y189_9BACT|nr:MAG: hypothetical protein A2744_04050 [Candidatus Buchananbacteria bacterium RIFCSPHIGHO2_01_FULL_44_11]
MKVSKNSRFILFLVVFLVVSFAIFWSWLTFKKIDRPANQAQVQAVRNIDLEKQYEQSLKEILKPFWPTKDPAGIRLQIIDLRAPARYLDLHINLVLAFDLFEQGQAESDQAKIEAGLERLTGLKNQYPWLE